MQPAVSVPDVGADVNQFIKIIDKSGLFESHEMSSDDISRNSYYEQNQKRDTFSLTFEDYSEYLKSLKMVATIENFKEINLSRITQLVNKTNQFNLTTKRYSPAEIEEVYRGENYIALSGRLQDKFGDNGLISIIIGSIKNQHLKIELWVMSCRVIKREMEYAMLESLIKECTKKNIKSISGKYIPSLKNNMVKNLYQDLGFKKQDDANENYDLFYIDLKNIKSLPVHQIRIKNE
jgi:FkbH-like protein